MWVRRLFRLTLECCTGIGRCVSFRFVEGVVNGPQVRSTAEVAGDMGHGLDRRIVSLMHGVSAGSEKWHWETHSVIGHGNFEVYLKRLKICGEAIYGYCKWLVIDIMHRLNGPNEKIFCKNKRCAYHQIYIYGTDDNGLVK